MPWTRPTLPALFAAAAMLVAGCVAPAQPGANPGSGSGSPAAQGLEVVVTGHPNGPASEVTVAVNPKDPLNLIGGSKDFTLGKDPGPGCSEYNVWSGVYWTKDGGKTWKNGLMAGYPGDANQTLLSRYDCNSDPVVVFGPDGTAYYSGLAYGGRGRSAGGSGACPDSQEAPLCGRSIWIASSTDGGDTWANFVNIAVSDDAQTILDKQWFAVNPNDPLNLVMTWITFGVVPGAPAGAAQFFISASFDGAKTWTPAAPLGEVGAPVHQFAMPAFGADNQVYVIWRNFGPAPLPDLPLPIGTPGTPQIMFTRNLPDSPAFAPAVGIQRVNEVTLQNADFRASSYPVLAVDNSGGPNQGNLYIAWPDEQGDQADILLIRSSDGGQTWSPPVKVLDSPADQFMVWLTVDEEGGVDLAFLDRGYAPGNEKIDLTLARSVDAGATFATKRVTAESWAVPEGCYHQRGFPFIGDYIGLAAGGGVLHPFWADGRNGRCEVMSAATPYGAVGGTAGKAAAGNATRGEATR